MAQGIVTEIKDRTVNTAYGAKKAYDVYIDGRKYGFGFKKPGASVGDTVSYVTVKNGAYENITTLEVVTAPVGGPAAATRVAASYGSKGVFPIPPLDGQRAIVRQNALLHATNIVVHSFGGKAFAATDELAAVVVNIAKTFEAYACGDIESQAVAAEIAEE